MALTVLSGEGRIVRHELVDRIHARTISKTASLPVAVLVLRS